MYVCMGFTIRFPQERSMTSAVYDFNDIKLYITCDSLYVMPFPMDKYRDLQNYLYLKHCQLVHYYPPPPPPPTHLAQIQRHHFTSVCTMPDLCARTLSIAALMSISLFKPKQKKSPCILNLLRISHSQCLLSKSVLTLFFENVH